MSGKVKTGQSGKERAARLAQALRDNLRKRKEQARQRSQPDDVATVPPREGDKGAKDG